MRIQSTGGLIRRHVIRDVHDLTAEGWDEHAAFRQAKVRLFGAPPGSYGAGVAQLVESGQWDTTDDLDEMYIRWSFYAYGRGTFIDVSLHLTFESWHLAFSDHEAKVPLRGPPRLPSTCDCPGSG